MLPFFCPKQDTGLTMEVILIVFVSAIQFGDPTIKSVAQPFNDAVRVTSVPISIPLTNLVIVCTVPEELLTRPLLSYAMV